MTTFEKDSKANKMKSMVNTNRNLHLTLRYGRGPFEKTLVETKENLAILSCILYSLLWKVETCTDPKMMRA